MQNIMDITVVSSVPGAEVTYALGIVNFMQQSRRYLLLCTHCIAAALMKVCISVVMELSMESMLDFALDTVISST